ncbi:MAG TPA: hypothetical protein PLD62_10590, partial [Candidatus Cloacimonadota bacterium]|nr:hypothetical protein [Candidatus Cloacimonadota bacterium]
MKNKLFWFLIILVLFSACENNSTSPIKIAEPSDLILTQLDRSSIQLSWLDNSDNEEGFIL